MNKAYNKITWQNKPSTATPLNQTNLNEMSNALDTIDDRVIALDSGKVGSVTITNTLQTGDTIATITVDGTATNIKSAQVEVDAEPSATSENPLQNKAIYEMLNNLLPEETAEGNPISISDASGLNAKACSVDLLPIQDLHGYDSPWAGGAGKNKLPITLTEIKQRNTAGTWTDNIYAYRDVSITVNTNENDYITSISFSGTISQVSSFILCEFNLPAGTYKANGCNFGSRTTTRLIFQNISTSAVLVTVYSGQEDVEFTIESQAQVRCYFVIANDLSSGTFYPMIRLSTVTDATFAPYSNICPISGRTEASVTRTGKNLFDKTDTSKQFAGYIGSTSIVGGSSGHLIVYIPCFPNTTYTVSRKRVTTNERFSIAYTTELPADSVSVYGVISAQNSGSVGDLMSLTLTTGENASYLVVWAYWGDTTTALDTLQIELGSTATTYEPYQGETYTETLGQTVYGGKVDFVNGGLSNEWGYIASYNGETLPREWISDRDVYAPNTTPTNGAEVAYKLATPTEITLTAEQISLLKGNNTISTSGDNINLVYSADIKAWVENQLQS